MPRTHAVKTFNILKKHYLLRLSRLSNKFLSKMFLTQESNYTIDVATHKLLPVITVQSQFIISSISAQPVSTRIDLFMK